MLRSSITKPAERLINGNPSPAWKTYFRARKLETFRLWVGGATGREIADMYGLTANVCATDIRRIVWQLGWLWQPVGKKQHPFYEGNEQRRKLEAHLENMWVMEEQFPVDWVESDRRVYLSLDGEWWRALERQSGRESGFVARGRKLVRKV